MKILKLALVLISAVLIFGSCGSPAGTNINGNIANANDITIYFDKMEIGNAMSPLQNTPAKSGKFSFNFPEGIDKGTYRVRMGAKNMMLIFDGTEKDVKIDADLSNLQSGYTISGSPLSQQYIDKIIGFRNKEIDMATMDKFVSDEADPLVSAALLNSLYSGNYAKNGVFAAVAKRMLAADPESKVAQDYQKMAMNMEATYRQQQAQNKVKIGAEAPDIVSKNPSGKTMKLSDLEGQVVLLDFWASWCGPCRRSNPKVVEAYKKYKKDGFTVFNVSLDGLDERTKQRLKTDDQVKAQMEASKKKWLAAIEKDKLTWPYHVSDLKKWDSDAAQLYGVRSIPTTYLIDRDGKIASKNPTKGNLQGEIEKLL